MYGYACVSLRVCARTRGEGRREERGGGELLQFDNHHQKDKKVHIWKYGNEYVQGMVAGYWHNCLVFLVGVGVGVGR